MDKKEYDQIEEQANRLQSEAGRRCNQKLTNTTKDTFREWKTC